MRRGFTRAEDLRALALRATELAEMLEDISLRPPTIPAPFLDEQARRTHRRKFLPPDLFGEPAWDMLVDLMIARDRDRRISIGSLCIASQVPATTALRYIALLEARGCIERECDRNDGRRVYLKLTGDTVNRMQEWAEAQNR